MSEVDNFRVPTWCPICEGLMKGKSTGTYYSFGCCVNCFIEFVEQREDRWKSGWRPDKDDIARYRERFGT